MNPYLPMEAEIIERIQESSTLFTLRLRFTDPQLQASYQFAPGQFNMLYLPNVGDHTIRSVGRISRGMEQLKEGDRIGIRGPFGRGWPLLSAEQKDVIIVTGGLGCAPVVSVINYVMRRRERFGTVNIIQGVKHRADFIWKERYDQWRAAPDTNVLLASDTGEAIWPWHVGPVTGLFDKMSFATDHVIAMMCGAEGMMRAVISHLVSEGVCECDIWLSMERNMQCAVGHCGHCQYGASFVCKDGPVFCYEEVKPLFGQRGF